VDLFGDIFIAGGSMNILGGTDRSYWPGSGTHTVEISNGELNFQNIGIFLRNNDMNYNISGGKIRTGGDFYSLEGVSVFDPSGGTVELYGTGPGNVNLGTGSYFHNLVIDKPTVTVYPENSFQVKNALDVKRGTFNTYGNLITVGP
jgi:hypothetical protein